MLVSLFFIGDPQAMSDSKTKSRKKATARFAIVMLISALAGYCISSFIFKIPGLKQSLPAFNVFDAFVFLLLVLAVLAIHELGHLAAGFSRGMKFLLFVVGPFQWIQTPEGVRFSLVFNLGSFGGLAAAMPDPGKELAPQLKRLVMGGPLSSLVLAALCLLAGFLLQGKPAMYFYFTGGFSFLIFLVTALPFRAGGFMSDGMQFIELTRGGRAVEERQNIITLTHQSMGGMRPRDLDQAIIERILAYESLDPMRQVIARYYAYITAFDRGEFERAGQYIEWIAEHIEQYPQGFRQSLTLEVCLHHVLQGRLEQARKWMKLSSGGLVDQSRRALIEAELALLENDKTRASASLAKARKLVRRSYDKGMRIMTEDQIEQAEQKLSV